MWHICVFLRKFTSMYCFFLYDFGYLDDACACVRARAHLLSGGGMDVVLFQIRWTRASCILDKVTRACVQCADCWAYVLVRASSSNRKMAYLWCVVVVTRGLLRKWYSSFGGTKCLEDSSFTLSSLLFASNFSIIYASVMDRIAEVVYSALALLLFLPIL